MTELQPISCPNIPGASQQLRDFVGGIRLFIRDFPELNRLVAGEETSDRMIAFFVEEALSEFSSTPPNLGIYTFSYFMERGWNFYLRMGAIVHVLESIGMLQTRNYLSYSDGGVTVSVSDKTPLLQSWLQFFKARWETWIDRIKVAENIEGALTNGIQGVSSEYFLLHGFLDYDWFNTSDITDA